jgi:hypothetical protein
MSSPRRSRCRDHLAVARRPPDPAPHGAPFAPPRVRVPRMPGGRGSTGGLSTLFRYNGEMARPRSELGGHVTDSAEPRSTPGGAAPHAAGPAASATPVVNAWPAGPEIVDAPNDPVIGLLLTATELGVALVVWGSRSRPAVVTCGDRRNPTPRHDHGCVASPALPDLRPAPQLADPVWPHNLVQRHRAACSTNTNAQLKPQLNGSSPGFGTRHPSDTVWVHLSGTLLGSC